MAIFAIAQTAYVTKTGSKYHSDGCRYLSRSCISMSLSEAKSEGYAPAAYAILQHKYTKSMLPPIRNGT